MQDLDTHGNVLYTYHISNNGTKSIFDLERQEPLILVRFPADIELYDNDSLATGEMYRVVIKKPTKMVTYDNRVELYDLLWRPQVNQGWRFTDSATSMIEAGYTCFAFTDGTQRHVEYVLANASSCVLHFEDGGSPAGDEELINALQDLQSFSKVSLLYGCKPESILQRIKFYNERNALNPYVPPYEYLVWLHSSIRYGFLNARAVAASLGVDDQTLHQWLNIS